ncbi:MAG: hypothetical protein ACD_8C00021G0002 [uncultured bacterium]|nr:MAG: hypothetical protein ACD_8C00021G0002 [uncultured bacterium]
MKKIRSEIVLLLVFIFGTSLFLQSALAAAPVILSLRAVSGVTSNLDSSNNYTTTPSLSASTELVIIALDTDVPSVCSLSSDSGMASPETTVSTTSHSFSAISVSAGSTTHRYLQCMDTATSTNTAIYDLVIFVDDAPVPDIPVADLVAGTYNDPPKTVTITSEVGTVIDYRFILAGQDFDEINFCGVYPDNCVQDDDNSVTLTISATQTIRARACDYAGSLNCSDPTLAEWAYVITSTTFTVTPSAGANGTISPSTAQTINSGSTTTFTVTPSSGYTATVGGTCGGSLVGTTYTTNAITANCTVSATFASTENQVVAPTTSPAAGTYSSAQSVTLSSTTDGDTIYYTTDGSTPTTSSALYSGAISISSTTTLKAIAVKSGMTDSTVMSSLFTISTGTGVANVSAGADKTVGAPTTLIGLATGTGLTYEWTKQSGPGAITFGSSTSATTTVSATVDGTYVLRLTATDGSDGTAYDDMTLIWDSAPPTATFDSFGTTDTTPQLAGTSTGSPVSVNLYIGSATYTATLSSDGTWTAGITSALTPNAYNVRVRAFDLAGNYNDNYVVLTISSGTSTTTTTTSTSSSSSSSENNSKKIKNTSKFVKGGDTIVQTGKRFPKNAKVLLFYQNSNGSYNAPQMIKTDDDGKFSIKYVVKKTPGVYNWFAQDYNSGTRSWSKYRVK